jgi:hypothetical protein
MQNKLIIAIFISVFSYSSAVNGQNQINSPYSRFNLGSLAPSGSYRSQGMGGVSTAIRDNSSIYFSNPASYSSLDTNSFVFDFGVEYGKNILSSGGSKYSSEDMDFDHLIMGFPLAKGWGFSFGVIPFSNGYYNISDQVLSTDPGYDPSTGEYTSYHKGNGGFYKVFAGTGIRLTRNFFIGVNMTYLLGSVSRINYFNFADYYNTFQDNNTEELQLAGVNFEYGLQYTTPLKNDHYLNVGFSLTPDKNYTSRYKQLTYSYNAYGSADTLSYNAEKSKSSNIPATLRAGIVYGKTNKFTTALDFIYTRWSKSNIPGSAGYMADSRSLLFGAELIPDKYSNYSLLKRMEYRIGGHIGNNYLIVNGAQVKELGVSAGIGIPMKPGTGMPMNRSNSKTTLFFDYTKKYGSSSANLHTENVFTVGISLNLYDYWFLKRKYD